MCLILKNEIQILLFMIVNIPSSLILIIISGGNIDENSTIDNQVFISGCDEPPCKFNKNSSMSVDIYFEPGKPVFIWEPISLDRLTKLKLLEISFSVLFWLVSSTGRI